MDLIEIADAIPKTYQDQVENELGSNRMLWTFSDEIASSGSGFETAYPGFGHMAYLAHESEPVISPLSSLLLPILFVFCEKANIEYRALLRIRVGLFTRTAGGAKHHNPHVDYDESHRTAVYYVNDADGDTFLFDETVDGLRVADSGRYARQKGFTVRRAVSPQKGKMICFDGRHYHASSYPTSASKRIAVTFNFA
ncbi:MAG TPA: 2OG-Fe(II) oxygenase [Polyangia bacterium]|jgi:hypothetical protein|nr:2OG-Fe(II) oxygenase [Polyangia bacterium]